MQANNFYQRLEDSLLKSNMLGIRNTLICGCAHTTVGHNAIICWSFWRHVYDVCDQESLQDKRNSDIQPIFSPMRVSK